VQRNKIIRNLTRRWCPISRATGRQLSTMQVFHCTAGDDAGIEGGNRDHERAAPDVRKAAGNVHDVGDSNLNAHQ
jgi:hypothetical protein